MFNVKRKPWIPCLIGLMLSLSAWADFSLACSRILWNTNKQAVLVARSMDWSQPFGERLVIYPRGMRMEGMPGENPAIWISKYGSIGVVPFGMSRSISKKLMESGVNGADPLVNGNSEGVNEKGLAAHGLALETSAFGARDLQKPGVSTSEWVRYVLDNFETVRDAIAGLKEVQIVCAKAGGANFPQHLALEDSSGDSAIVEMIDGKMIVHQGREYTVLTNDPPYPAHLENLKRYETFGGTNNELPGGIEPLHRFVRAMEYLRTLPEPKDQHEAITYLYSVIRSVSVPYGAVYHSLPGSPTYPTRWTSITDLTNRIFYFNAAHSHNTIRVMLKEIDFSAGKPIKVLDPAQIDLTGNVTKKFGRVAP